MSAVRTALVTGASSGIGEAFARTLASRGVALLLTGLPREQDRLDFIADELSRKHGIRCLAVATDLAEPDGPALLQAAADELGFEPDLIVNSAGLGAGGRFSQAPLDEQLRMINVNVTGLVHLTGLYLPRLVARGGVGVINIASTAALQPVPYFSVYAASKAFVLSFGEAIWAESRSAGVRVVTVCTGPVETPFHGHGDQTETRTPIRGYLRRRYLTTQRVVDSALRALDTDSPMVVLRIPIVGLLSHPFAIIRSLLPLRVRLLLSERLSSWYFEQGESAEVQDAMSGKVCMITGATSGLGLATARQMAAQGATVVIVGRTPTKCTAAVQAVRSAVPGATLDWLAADFAVQSEIRALAAEFQRRYERLDVLVNNAGTILPRREVLPVGIEMTLAVNHLAPFLLTNLLLDVLRASAPARIVNVASVAHEGAHLDFGDLSMSRGYRPFRAYARSKLANLLFTVELARRLESSGVTANAMNPGLVRTDLGKGDNLLLDLGWWLAHLRHRAVSLTPDQGADTIVFLACAPEVKSVTGKYFFQRKPTDPSPAGRDVDVAQRLWLRSEQWTGMDAVPGEAAPSRGGSGYAARETMKSTEGL